MATETPTTAPTAPTAPPPTKPTVAPMTVAQAVEALKLIDTAKLQAKLDETRKYYMQWAGKSGCNPYMYLTKTVATLQQALDKLNKEPFSSPVEKLAFAQDVVAATGALEMDEKYAIHDKASYVQEQNWLKAKADAALQPPKPPGIAVGGV